MSKFTKLTNFIKSKLGTALVAGTLVLTPSGVALAHGNDDNNRRGDGDRNHSRSTGFNHNDKRHHKDKDNNWWKNRDNQASCEERQANANQKVTDYKNRVQTRLNGLSAFLTNQQTFVSTNNLTIEGYDTANQKAEEAKTSAFNALANTQAPTIDCNTSEQKDNEAIFRSINELRKATKHYESSVQKVSAIVIDKITVS